MQRMETDMQIKDLTPADQGLLAVAIDDAISEGLSDDCIVDRATWAMIGDGMDDATAASIAYDAWHSGWYRANVRAVS